MNLIFELIPTLFFFAAYAATGLYVAVAVLMAAMIALVASDWWFKGRRPTMQLIITFVVVVLSTLTIWLRNPDFIKFKPTAIYGGIALALLGSQFIGKKVLMARMPQNVVIMPDAVWRKVNLAWAAFFALSAVLNLYVASHYSEATWVKVKSFGFPVLTFAFLLLHAPFLLRYVVDENAKPELTPDAR